MALSRFVRRARRSLRRRRVRLRVPGTAAKVWIRRDTSDRAAFEHVFGGAYALDLPTDSRLIVDLGANVGFASVYLALRYPDARVIAVEPEPSNAELLRKNARACPQIEVVEAAAWPRPERLAVKDVGKGQWGMRVAPDDRGAVRGVTIPELVGEGPIDLLKVDIEGSELELFADDAGWVARVGTLVIELHDRFRPGCREAVVGALERSGRPFAERRSGEDTIFVQLVDDEHGAAGARSSTRHAP